MVQIIDKNPSDFTNTMITQHKAFFNIDDKESQNIIRQHIVLQSTNITKEDEKLLKEDQIKQENPVSMEEETYNDNKSDILEGEYIEVEDILVEEENKTQENGVHKPSPKEDKIKQECSVSMEEEINIDKQSDILACEYIEDEDIIVKELETTNDNIVQKPSPQLQPKPIALSQKAVTNKRPVEELVT